MCSGCCYSCPLKLIWDIMAPSCLQKQGHGENLGARARQLTLEEILYPQPSWEMEAVGSAPARRNSPKVCPMNLNFSDDDEGHSPAVDEQSVSISRASIRSQSSVSRRVSFRSPDESDIFIIPARSSDSDDDDDDVSSDGSDQ